MEEESRLSASTAISNSFERIGSEGSSRYAGCGSPPPIARCEPKGLGAVMVHIPLPQVGGG